MYVVAGVEEIRVGEDAEALPFEDGGGGADEVDAGILSAGRALGVVVSLVYWESRGCVGGELLGFEEGDAV